MSSEWLKKHLLDAIDGTLNDSERKRLEEECKCDPEVEQDLNGFCRIIDISRKIPESEAPLDFTSTVMERLQGITHPWWVRFWYFLTRPRQLRVSVVGGVVCIAVFVLGAVLIASVFLKPEPGQMVASNKADKEYVVQFTYYNPDAKQVYVTGSFNGWRKDRLPMVDTSGRGIWMCLVAMKPGTYEYMFIVDGQWVTDEHARHYKDDGFGRKNAVLNLNDGDEINA